jgi:hypothetical protein
MIKMQELGNKKRLYKLEKLRNYGLEGRLVWFKL